MDQKFVDRLAPVSKRTYHWDDAVPGLCLVQQPSGHRSWRAQRDLWRDGRRVRTVYETRPGTLKLADARTWAKGFNLQIEMGVDPQAPPPPEDAPGPEAWTVLHALETRLAWATANLKPNSVADLRMSIKYLTALHGVPLGKLSKEQCRRVHEAITTNGLTGKGARDPANKAMHHLGAAWQHARKFDEARRLPEEPPTKGVFLNKTRKRAARLGPDLLPAWAAVVAAEPNPVRRAFHWFSLLTGLRGDSACRIRREWVQADRVVIPREDMKVDAGRNDFVVPLSARLRQVVAEAMAAGDTLVPGTPWLFPSVKAASGHLEEWKVQWQGKETAFAHDLRKVYRTQLEELAPANIARSMTDHAAPGIDGHYVMHSHLFAARLQAQEAVSARLVQLCAG